MTPIEPANVAAGLRVTMPRRKPRLVWAAAFYRLYSLLRRAVPVRALRRATLNLAWLCNRVAWEQIWYSMRPEDALTLLRPHTLATVQRFVPPGSRVIDVGCGTGVVTRAVAGIAGSVVALDHSATALEAARRLCASHPQVRFVAADWRGVLHEQGPFDVALLLHLLEHLDEPVEALADLRQSCRRLIIEVPDFASDPLNFARLKDGVPVFSDADHVTEFTEQHLAECLAAADWRLARMERTNGVIIAVADAAAT